MVGKGRDVGTKKGVRAGSGGEGKISGNKKRE